MLKDLADALLKSLISPVRDAILRLSWPYRLSILLVAVAPIGVTKYPTELESFASFARYAPRALLSREQIPLSEASHAHLHRSIDTLTRVVRSYFDKRNFEASDMNAWAMAQMAIALKDVERLVPTKFSHIARSDMDSSCHCWREFQHEPVHLGASSWVVLALSYFDVPLTDEQVEFFLEMQSPDGWWPMFPATSAAHNASTFSTVWTAYALHEHLRREHISDTYKEHVRDAIDNAVVWLWNTRLEGRVRWSDYHRSNDDSAELMSMSAIVLHVLHQIDRHGYVRELERAWLRDLPHEPPEPPAEEMSNVRVRLHSGAFRHDKVRYYAYPWMLIATVDSYSHGSIWERAKVLRWLERAAKQDVLASNIVNRYWVAAEVLIALRYFELHLHKKNEAHIDVMH
jgi:hypothetical protein